MKNSSKSSICSVGPKSIAGIGRVLTLALLCVPALLAQPKKVASTISGTVTEVMFSRYGSHVKANVNGKVYEFGPTVTTDDELMAWTVAVDKFHPGDLVTIVLKGSLNESPGGENPVISIRLASPSIGQPAVSLPARTQTDPTTGPTLSHLLDGHDGRDSGRIRRESRETTRQSL